MRDDLGDSETSFRTDLAGGSESVLLRYPRMFLWFELSLKAALGSRSLSSDISARSLEVDGIGQLSDGRCRYLEPDKSSVGNVDFHVLALDGVMASGERKYSPETCLLVVGVNEYGEGCRLGITNGSSKLFTSVLSEGGFSFD